MLETFMTLVGFIGSAAFAFCTAPQLIKAYKRKSTADISMLFIVMSIIGNISSATYIFYTNFMANFWQLPQYFNYSIALTMVVTLLCMKIHYDKRNK